MPKKKESLYDALGVAPDASQVIARCSLLLGQPLAAR